jgi:hypothetical protein
MFSEIAMNISLHGYVVVGQIRVSDFHPENTELGAPYAR